MNIRTLNAGYKFFYCLLIFIEIISAEVTAQSGNKIAAFGSSVCFGTGDNLGRGGYVGRFSELMKKYSWEVVNVSRGGDNTKTINERWQKTDKEPHKKVSDNQYLIPQKPDYVIIGLSLNNEGIRNVPEDRQDSILEKFKNGLLNIIERCRTEGFRVIVTNCYANGLFTEKQYELTRKMNLIINGWDLPSINLLGALDDGHGRWPEGFNYDNIHPSAGGHQEMFYTIVPSLFDALKTGKPTPKFVNSDKYASVRKTKDAFLFTPDDTIHSFAVSFLIREHGNCKLAEIPGWKPVLTKTEFEVKGISKSGLVLSASKELEKVKIEIKNDKLIYTSGAGKISSDKIKKDKWYRVTLSHCLGNGQTTLFLDSLTVGKINERIIPDKFFVGLNGNADYKDLLIYRSSVNINEVKSLTAGKMIQSSLEIYSPLNDEDISKSTELKNLAQSMSVLKIVTQPGNK